jgi:hypothetical protein
MRLLKSFEKARSGRLVQNISLVFKYVVHNKHEVHGAEHENCKRKGSSAASFEFGLALQVEIHLLAEHVHRSVASEHVLRACRFIFLGHFK